MQPRVRLLHTVTRQMETLLPTIRVTGVRPLALMVLGLLWAGSVSLPRIAARLPLPATDASVERRLRRWLANARVKVTVIWPALLPALLASRGGSEVTIVFDPTPHADRATVLVLGLVVRRRVLPVSWRVMPPADWPVSQMEALREMVTEVDAALPEDCVVTLLADRGLTCPELIDICRAVGWHFVLRLSVGAKQHNRVRALAGAGEAAVPEGWLWALVTGPGQRLARPVEVFKKGGWRPVELTIHWARSASEPWVLLSDRPAGCDRVRKYRRRMRCEATYEDCKGRGFAVERSKLVARDRVDRLLLALHVALWWGEQLGLRVIRRGERRRYDRADRRDLSVLRLGMTALHAALDSGIVPPLPFHRRHGAWHSAWLA